MAKKTKKSRFGNPAKASADAATRSVNRPSLEARLNRAMESLSPGFVAWLEAQSRPDKSIDMSLAILDDFFDMYPMLEPHTDPTNLDPAAVQEVMEVTSHANPLGVLTLRAGVRDYVDYLTQAKLWTGTAEDLGTVQSELARTGVDPAESDWAPEDYEFADVFVPELSSEEILETVTKTPLWQNTMALLEWIGDGKELNEDNSLTDAEGAASTLVHSGLGLLSDATKLATAEDRSAARLALYLDMLDVTGLITFTEGQLQATKPALDPESDDDVIETMRELMGLFIFTVTLAGSDNGDEDGEEGELEYWQLEMTDWLTQCSSVEPPESALLIQALAEPDSVHPDLLSIATNIAHWADEGLVIVGEFIEVPPAYRADVVDMLSDDVPVQAVGPGANSVNSSARDLPESH